MLELGSSEDLHSLGKCRSAHQSGDQDCGCEFSHRIHPLVASRSCRFLIRCTNIHFQLRVLVPMLDLSKLPAMLAKVNRVQFDAANECWPHFNVPVCTLPL